MPPKSEAQRKLMYTAASHKNGIGGVSQAAAKEFVASDKPGKLPEKSKLKRKSLYSEEDA